MVNVVDAPGVIGVPEMIVAPQVFDAPGARTILPDQSDRQG